MTGTFRSHQSVLEDLWNEGLSGHALLQRYSDIADDFIIGLFNVAIATQKTRGQVAIIALGGYGRRELYPYSDIDLLILHDRKSQKVIKEVAEAVLYPLWDEGLDVGHSVRTVKDAVTFAREDFIFQVSLLDARLLAGSEQLFLELKEKYTKKIFEGRRSKFVETMEQFRSDRREKYGSHAYLLEPHIKEGKGGMRDIQAMIWVAKGVFGLYDLDSIESSAMMSREDRLAFEASWNMLAKIRNQLHYLRRRKDDQLIFEFQEEMAEAFGYEDKDGMLSVEHFMQEVYGHLQTIAVVTDLFFEYVQEVLGLAGKDEKELQLEHSIISRNHSVRLKKVEDLRDKPYLLMRLFLQSGRTGYPLHHRTRQKVAAHLHLVDDRFRNSKRVARIFLAILRESKEVFSVLESMLVSGLLTAYIPEFSTIETLAQHDLYHIYTVDRHLLQSVVELHQLREEKPDLFDSLADQEILFLATLLHDIGKGKQTDHSERGAAMIEVIGRRMQLTGEQIELLSFVVHYHLFMPENALRRDLGDQQFIVQTAELIKDVQRLTMLYLISIADSKATGPSAWSTWKSGLLADFYLQLKTCLEGLCHAEEHGEEHNEQGVAWLRDQIHKQLGTDDALRIDINDLPDDYLVSFTSEVIARHLQIHHDHYDRLQQQVLLFADRRQHSWSLLVMTKDRTGLLAKICGVLALHHLSALAAQIFTWPDGTVVDVIEVSFSLNYTFDELDWDAVERDCNLAINYRLDIDQKLQVTQQPLGAGRGGILRNQARIQQVEQKVVIDNDTSQFFTLIEVHGSDFYGALYQLTRTLADFSLSIHKAKVATEVELLINVFYVTMSGGEKLLDPALMHRVRETLLEIITREED